VTANSKNQGQRILDRLLQGGEVPSVALSRISLQYGARVKELREMGFKISNRTERHGGKVCGYFRLDSAPTPEHKPSKPKRGEATQPTPGVFPQFGRLEPEGYGPS
jgi:hypothetical protein